MSEIKNQSDLLLLTPRVGDLSETFIQRHINDLAGGTRSVFCRQVLPSDASAIESRVLDRRHGNKAIRSGLKSTLGSLGLIPNREWAPSRRALGIVDEWSAANPGVPVLAEYMDQWITIVLRLAEHGHPCVVHGHGYDVSERATKPYWQDRYGRLLDVAKVVVPSQVAARTLADFGLRTDRLYVIPCGVDVPASVPGLSADLDNRVKLCAIGRLVAKKDQTVLVRALGLIRKSGIDAELTIVGEGPRRKILESVIHANGLQKYVHLVGALPHSKVLSIISNSDVLVQNSVVDPKTGDSEGLPVAILEAMAAGVPVVATRHAGIPEAILDGGTGLLVDEGSVDGFVKQITLLVKDRNLVDSIRNAALDKVRTDFNESHQLAKLREVLGVVGPMVRD